MIHIRRAETLHHSHAGWLESRWHFSFDTYFDPENMEWGSLRVFNDDIIQPNSGFPMHPHDNMEIVTYVIEGSLTHVDSLGNRGTTSSGEVQRM
ncbi:MAG: pirin family protein, partial [archaeon]